MEFTNIHALQRGGQHPAIEIEDTESSPNLVIHQPQNSRTSSELDSNKHLRSRLEQPQLKKSRVRNDLRSHELPQLEKAPPKFNCTIFGEHRAEMLRAQSLSESIDRYVAAALASRKSSPSQLSISQNTPDSESTSQDFCVRNAFKAVGVYLDNAPPLFASTDVKKLSQFLGSTIILRRPGGMAPVTFGAHEDVIILSVDSQLTHCDSVVSVDIARVTYPFTDNLVHVTSNGSLQITPPSDSRSYVFGSFWLLSRRVKEMLRLRTEIHCDFNTGHLSMHLTPIDDSPPSHIPPIMLSGGSPGVCFPFFAVIKAMLHTMPHVGFKIRIYEFKLGDDKAASDYDPLFLIGSTKPQKKKAKKTPAKKNSKIVKEMKTMFAAGDARPLANRDEPTLIDLMAAMKKPSLPMFRSIRNLANNAAQHPSKSAFASNFGVAANFGRGMAATYGLDGDPAYVGKDGELYSFPEQLIEDVLEGKKHPPRFGYETAVMQVSSARTLTLAALTAGYDVIITTPLQSAHKGSIVLQRSGTTWSVLAYVAPDVEIEDICERSAVLFTQLNVASLQLAGGTTVVASNAVVESGTTFLSPLAIQTGKMRAVAGLNNATVPVSLGKQGATLSEFTYDLSDVGILKYNNADPLDLNLTLSPSPQASNASCGKTSARSMGVHVRAPGGDSAADATNSGYNSTTLPSNGTVIVTTSPTPGVTSAAQKLFGFASHMDFLRHLWYGRFNLNFSFNIGNSITANNLYEMRCTVTYSDASTMVMLKQIRAASIGAGQASLIAGSFDSDLDSTSDAKSGLLVTNVELHVSVASSVASNVISYISPWAGTAVNSIADISLEWFDIMPETKYVSHIISGLVSAHTIALDARTDVEVFLRKGTKSANFVQIERAVPFNPHDMQLAYKRARSIGPPVGEASAFTKFLKKGWRTINNVALKPLWKGAKEGIRSAATNAGNVLAASGAGLGQAASFGSGECRKSDDITFPIYFENGDAHQVQVIPGYGKCPEFVHSITDQPLTAANQDYEGTSDGLAFLIAALRTEGWPVKPGCFSAEVKEVSYSADSVSFRLLPINHGFNKARAVTNANEFILTPEGVAKADGSGVRRMNRSDLITTSLNISIERKDIEEPWKHSYDVRIWRLM